MQMLQHPQTRFQVNPNPNRVECDEKEAMFEKPLTPSDVGKLNRLVIPKQYAEKYFPIGDVSGTLLGFEDESGKFWNFRYSYWSSSQSYVLTKGWSRYVKEKGLHAGDVAVFERHRSEPQRLFIGWRRRGFCYNAQGYGMPAQDSRGQGHKGGGALGRFSYQADRRQLGGGGKEEGWTRGSISSSGYVENSNTTRLVRLFGVNLECQVISHHTASSHPVLSQQKRLVMEQEMEFTQDPIGNVMGS